jgi:glutamine synthetase
VLFHEKPYAGVNGSGKHNNWSLATNTAKNLLRPAKTPKENIQFLAFFVSTIKAIQAHADVLRASIASANNDHRLGANEAPPAIISVFIGEYLTNLLDGLEKNIKASMSPASKTELKLDIGRIPQVMLDNTDRNRRAPSPSPATNSSSARWEQRQLRRAMTVSEHHRGAQLRQFKKTADALIKKGVKKDEAILRVIRDLIVAAKHPLRGQWLWRCMEEGGRQARPEQHRRHPRAWTPGAEKETKQLFADHGRAPAGVELEARHEIELHSYTLKCRSKAACAGSGREPHRARGDASYQNRLIENVRGLARGTGCRKGEEGRRTQVTLIEEISATSARIKTLSDEMTEARKKANAIEDPAPRPSPIATRCGPSWTRSATTATNWNCWWTMNCGPCPRCGSCCSPAMDPNGHVRSCLSTVPRLIGCNKRNIFADQL